MRHVEANGIRFAYLEEGQGPLVLMFHGFPDTPYTWDKVMPQIAAKGYRVVAPYLRGYHPSSIPDRDTDSETLGRDVLALIEALNEGEPAIVIGHDYGAASAYSAAALGPDKIDKLFVIGIPHPMTMKPTLKILWGVRHFFFYKLPGAPQRFAKDDFAALPAIYKRWSPAWSPDPSEFTHTRESFSHPESLNAAFGYYRALETRPRPYMKTKLPMDTVAFAGTDDPILAPADYRRSARMYTGSYTVEEMPGGHFMHREHPERFAELLLKHL